MNILRNLLGGVLDLLFPPRRVCPLCGEFQEDRRICDKCLQSFKEYREEPECFKCGRFFHISDETIGGFPAGGDGAACCRDCLCGDRFFYLARSAGPYEGHLKRAVQRLKFNGRRDLADHLSGIMWQSMAGNPAYNRVDLIAAVPLSPGRLRQRGYNQAELLAYGLAGRMMAPVLPLLKKVRETSPQTSLDRHGREENLADAFILAAPGAVKGKTVLLVDDVITTGITLDTVSEVLVRGGAGTVLCITAAAGRTTPAAPKI